MWKSIKSKIILKKISKILSIKKLLQIIKLNKQIKKSINITIIDYQKFNQIEIELTLSVEKKILDFDFGEPNDKKYFHYFIDDRKTELKRDKDKDKEIISNKFKLVIDHKVESLSGLFKSIEELKEIKFIKWNKTNINDISFMFSNCYHLEKILNFSIIKSQNITNMSYLFQGCKSLEEIDLSNMNTANVIDMGNMFERCKALKRINVSNFNTSKVKNMSSMFQE